MVSNHIGVVMGGYLNEQDKLMDRTELNKRIAGLKKENEILLSAVTLIGGMAGNPDAVEACRNINRVARSTLEKIKEYPVDTGKE